MINPRPEFCGGAGKGRRCESSPKQPMSNKNSGANTRRPNQPKSSDSNKRKRGSSPEVVQRGNRQRMDAGAKRLCLITLKALMNDECGKIFSEPIDPVKHDARDYFSVISKPMDLGTVKRKLEGDKYFNDVEGFAADIKLTFSNAMLFNPSSHWIHREAKRLDGVFSKRWKLVEPKLNCEVKNVDKASVCNTIQKSISSQDQTSGVDSDSTKTLERNRKDTRKIAGFRVHSTDAAKQRLQSELVELSKSEMARNLQFLGRKLGLNDLKEERLVHAFIAAADEATLPKLRGSIKDISDRKDEKEVKPTKESKYERSSSPVKIVRKVKRRRLNEKKSADDGARASIDANDRKSNACSRKALPDDQKSNVSLPEKFISWEKTATYDSTPECSGDDFQVSPSKALRAAMLKSRFADIISKAMCQGKNADPVKMEHERQRLKRQHSEFKAKMDEQNEARKISREKEREASRMRLLKMESEICYEGDMVADLEKMVRCDSTYGGGKIGNRDLWRAVHGYHCRFAIEGLGLFIKNEYGDSDDSY